jgi:hypothetical protein
MLQGSLDTQLQLPGEKGEKQMVRLLMALILAGAAVFASVAGPTPLMKEVQPDSAKAGDEVTVSGTNLEKANVAAVYLTQGEKTIKVKVTSQTDTEVKFTIPQDLKAGRFGIMVLTSGGDNAREIDEPVLVSVE